MIDKVIMLIVSVMMPADVPDIRHMERMDSMEACLDGAKEYLSHDMTQVMRDKGALGLGAMCAFQERPMSEN